MCVSSAEAKVEEREKSIEMLVKTWTENMDAERSQRRPDGSSSGSSEKETVNLRGARGRQLCSLFRCGAAREGYYYPFGLTALIEQTHISKRVTTSVHKAFESSSSVRR